MDGLARVAGLITKTINVNGREYRLATPTLGAWAALEAELVRETNDILEKAAKVCGSIPKEQWSVFWETAQRLACQRSVFTLDDLAKLPPFEQLVVEWFLCLHRFHKDEFSTLDAVRRFLVDNLGQTPLTELEQLLHYVVSGGVKNSTSPAVENSPPTGHIDPTGLQ